MLINTFYSKQDHTFTKTCKFYERITRVLINNGRFRVVGAVNAMVVKNVKDANVPLKFLPICRKIGCKKNSFSFALHINKKCPLRPQKEILANLRPF